MYGTQLDMSYPSTICPVYACLAVCVCVCREVEGRELFMNEWIDFCHVGGSDVAETQRVESN